MHVADNDRNVKVIKRDEKPIPPQVWRLVCSLRSALERTYPDPVVREAVSTQIMTDFRRKFSLAQTQDVV